MKRWLSAAVCGALLAIAGQAAAVDPTTMKRAQERFVEGNRLFETGDYAGARVAYNQSLVLMPHGSTLRNLANAEMKLGDPLSALKHYRAAVNAPDLPADRKTTTQRELDEAYAATGHLAVSTRAGAALAVDGQAVDGTAPFADPIDVTAGKHAVEARLGALSAKAEVDARAGQVTSLEVAIDHAEVPSPPPVPSGPSSSAVVAPAPPPEAGQAPALEAPAFWNTRRDVGVVIGGVGVLSLGASILFTTQASSQSSSARGLAATLPPGSSCAGPAQPLACGALRGDQSTQKTDATLSAVFLGAGAAATVVGALMFFWPSAPTAVPSAQASIVPFITPQGGGFVFRGEL